MRFFSQFPKVPYSFDQFTPSINTQVIDIYRYVDVNRDITNDLAAYLTYSIKDGERPDQVSHKLYKSPDFHWTFFIINEGLKNGLEDWPKSYIELDEYIKTNYSKYSVLEFFPKQDFDQDNNLAMYNNYFGRLEFDGRLKMIRNAEGKNLKATPVLYNSEKLQLWVEDAESSFLSNNDETYNFIYEGSKRQKLEWANKYGLQWCEESYPELYKVLNDETTVVSDNITPFERGIIDFPETPQVFDVEERTVDMFDLDQNFDISYSPSPSTFGWEDGYVDTEDTNDEYDEEFLFYRGEITIDDVDPTQVWEQALPRGITEENKQEILALTDPSSFAAELEQIENAPLIAVDWNGKTPVTAEIDEPNKGEWYPYGTDALGIFFMDKYLQLIKFKTRRSYSESFNAPQSYSDDDTRITAYDALNADINNSNYTTYYEYENDENEAKRDIVVLRESAVEPFAERYEELLNE